MSDEEWRRKLTPEQYQVLRQKGTEAPFTGDLFEDSGKGIYRCAACGTDLFRSDAKYKSGQPGLEGWPSFADAARSNAVKLMDDKSFGLVRKEVACAECESHLGHIFDDDSSPTGQHYCINSVCLKFQPESEKDIKAHG